MENDTICVYESEEINKQSKTNQNMLDDILKSHRVINTTIKLDEPTSLDNYKQIAKEVKSVMEGKFNSEVATTFSSDLNRFIYNRGSYDSILISERTDDGFMKYIINWNSPVSATAYNHLVHAVQCQMIQTKERPISVLMGLFGFTHPNGTNIQNQETLMEKHGIEGLSSAFTFHKGFVDPLAGFYNLLGREITDRENKLVGIKQLDDWFNKYGSNKVNPYGDNQTQVSYATFPFSKPLDVIFYPHAKEFGGESLNDNIYLEKSLVAKALMKKYFEKITGEEIKIVESLPKNKLTESRKKEKKKKITSFLF